MEALSYFVARRRMNTYQVGMSLFATSVGGSSLFLSALFIHQYGPWGLLFELGGSVGLCFLGWVVVPFLYPSGSFSFGEFLSRGKPLVFRKGLSLYLAITEILWLALLVYSLYLLIPSYYATGGLLFLCALYTSLGGQKTIFLTDTWQTFIIFGGIILLILFQHPSSPQSHPFLNPSPTLATLAIMSTLAHMTGPDMAHRILSAQSLMEARKGAFLAGLLKLLWMTLFFFWIRTLPHGLVSWLSTQSSGMRWITLFILINILLSSMDTVLMSAITFVQRDIFSRLGLPSGLVGMVIAGISGGLAFFFPDLIELFKKSYGFFVAGAAMPILCEGLLPKGVHPIFFILALLFGGLMIFWDKFFLGLALSLAFAFIGASIQKRRKACSPR